MKIRFGVILNKLKKMNYWKVVFFIFFGVVFGLIVFLGSCIFVNWELEFLEIFVFMER